METALVRKKPRDIFKERLDSFKDELPRNYRQVLVHHYPAYGQGAGERLLVNVMSGRSIDIPTIEILEKIWKHELKLPKKTKPATGALASDRKQVMK